MAHAGGRPPKYGPGMIEKAQQFLDSCVDEEREIMNADKLTTRLVVNIPTIAGLALHLGVSRDTIQVWGKEHKEFSVIYEKLVGEQERRLNQKGLSGDYNSRFAQFLLSAKHGYREKTDTDVTSGGKPLSISWDE